MWKQACERVHHHAASEKRGTHLVRVSFGRNDCVEGSADRLSGGGDRPLQLLEELLRQRVPVRSLRACTPVGERERACTREMMMDV